MAPSTQSKGSLRLLAAILMTLALFVANTSAEAGCSLSSSCTLQAGDIAIIGAKVNGSPDTLVFLLLAPIPQGTAFYITDNGYKKNDNPTKWRWTENSAKFVASRSYDAGEIIDSLSPDMIQSGHVDGCTPNGYGAPLELRQEGDNVFIMQSDPFTTWTCATTGPALDVRFVYGMIYGGLSCMWTESSSTTGTSALPSALNDTSANVALSAPSTARVMQFTGSLCGSRDDILTAVNDPTQWSVLSDSSPMDTSLFTPCEDASSPEADTPSQPLTPTRTHKPIIIKTVSPTILPTP
eukprot:CAMPEP_0184658558 /NCGR_PEP_ID=MMETSP0308-20130426/25924_1 /TAXON_ID=38269 /ORGANISM="Gloeochaete witrockiana, Strain SAG 46.84" /LENGTH=294 /DNA_ID=CAMNT_0027097647 /DNA_START=390 /DNA_END=1271 /DNA_ORIENTATION=+